MSPPPEPKFEKSTSLSTKPLSPTNIKFRPQYYEIPFTTCILVQFTATCHVAKPLQFTYPTTMVIATIAVLLQTITSSSQTLVLRVFWTFKVYFSDFGCSNFQRYFVFLVVLRYFKGFLVF